MKTTIHQCYACEREIFPDEGAWITTWHNDDEQQVFMCHECIKEDEELCEGHEWIEEESYEDQER